METSGNRVIRMGWTGNKEAKATEERDTCRTDKVFGSYVVGGIRREIGTFFEPFDGVAYETLVGMYGTKLLAGRRQWEVDVETIGHRGKVTVVKKKKCLGLRYRDGDTGMFLLRRCEKKSFTESEFEKFQAEDLYLREPEERKHIRRVFILSEDQVARLDHIDATGRKRDAVVESKTETKAKGK